MNKKAVEGGMWWTIAGGLVMLITVGFILWILGSNVFAAEKQFKGLQACEMLGFGDGVCCSQRTAIYKEAPVKLESESCADAGGYCCIGAEEEQAETTSDISPTREWMNIEVDDIVVKSGDIIRVSSQKQFQLLFYTDEAHESEFSSCIVESTPASLNIQISGCHKSTRIFHPDVPAQKGTYTIKYIANYKDQELTKEFILVVE